MQSVKTAVSFHSDPHSLPALGWPMEWPWGFGGWDMGRLTMDTFTLGSVRCNYAVCGHLLEEISH